MELFKRLQAAGPDHRADHPRARGRPPRRPHLRDARWRAVRGRTRPGSSGMTLSDTLRTAVFALRGNWMRSALTSLGVIIGIAAVIVMVSVGQGTQAEIDKMVSGPGLQPARHQFAARPAPAASAVAPAAVQTLTDQDADGHPRADPGSAIRGRGHCAATRSWCMPRTTGRPAGRACSRIFSRSTAGSWRAAHGFEAGRLQSAREVGGHRRNRPPRTVRRRGSDRAEPAHRQGAVHAWSACSRPRARAASARTRTT